MTAYCILSWQFLSLHMWPSQTLAVKTPKCMPTLKEDFIFKHKCELHKRGELCDSTLMSHTHTHTRTRTRSGPHQSPCTSELIRLPFANSPALAVFGGFTIRGLEAGSGLWRRGIPGPQGRSTWSRIRAGKFFVLNKQFFEWILEALQALLSLPQLLNSAITAQKQS